MRREFRVTYTDGLVEVIEAARHDHDLSAVGGEHVFRTLGPDGHWLPDRIIDAEDIAQISEITRDA
jgi:hypothetical protein